METRYLGIDYGDARIGIALSYGSLAEPLEIIAHNHQALARIELLAHQHGVTHIVIGLSENIMAEKTHTFAEHIKKTTNLPVTFQDETLSSAEVHRLLRERSNGKQLPRGPIDHYAAALILQRFLDDLPQKTL